MVATAIVGSAVVGGVSSFAAGRTQARGAEASAALQADAMNRATDEQRRQYDITREDFAPYREVGTNALGQFGKMFGIGRDGLLTPAEMAEARTMFMETPGYDFRVSEGIKALDRSAAARGKLHGGAYGRELVRFGQGMATDEFDRYANRLAALSGIGQSATGSTASAGQATANALSNIYQTGAAQQGNAMMGAATARASGYAGVGNAAQNALGNYIFYDALKSGRYPTSAGWPTIN